MGKKFFAAFAVFAGLLAGLFGGNSAHATAGNTATISDGEWNICVSAASYAGSSFVADVSGTGFNAQLVFGDFETETCKAVQLATGGNSTVTMSLPMGVNGMGYTIDAVNNKLTFAFESRTNRYINVHGSVDFTIGASKVGISFNANGGEGTMAGLDNIDLNTNVTLTSNTFTYAGYSFNGWNTKADGTGTSYTDGETTSFTTGGEVTLFAQWKERYAQLDTGSNVNVKMKKLAGATGDVKVSTVDNAIHSIEVANVLPENFDTNNDANIISSPDSLIKVHAWFDVTDRNEDGDADNVIYIYSDESSIRSNDIMASMFSNMRAIPSLVFPSIIDTSYSSVMSHMFNGMTSLTSLVLPNSFDTSNVTDMRYIFNNMTSLTSLVLPNSFDTSNVPDMSYMFNNMSSLTSLVLPNSFDTSNVTRMNGMFKNMESLASLVFPSSFNTSNVTEMQNMFSGMSSLTSLALPESFNTSNVTRMNGMFENMLSLTSLTLPDSFNTSKVTDMYKMFAYVSSLTSLVLPDAFDTSSVKSMNIMFIGMTSLTSITFPESFDTSEVTNMNAMFEDVSSLTSLTLPDAFDTSKVTEMGDMFYGMSSLTSLILPDAFVIDLDKTSADYIFGEISTDASLCASDPVVRSLWPGVLGN